MINPLGHVIPTGTLQRSRPLFEEPEIGQVDVAAPNIIQRQPVNYNLTTGALRGARALSRPPSCSPIHPPEPVGRSPLRTAQTFIVRRTKFRNCTPVPL